VNNQDNNDETIIKNKLDIIDHEDNFVNTSSVRSDLFTSSDIKTEDHSELNSLFLSQRDDISIGTLLNNTYELIGFLGGGGMGSVFKAINKNLEKFEVRDRDTYVAIKVLKPEYSADQQLVSSLVREFVRTKKLSEKCENIIKVDVFDKDGANYFIVMEYIVGQTLGAYIDHQMHKLNEVWWIIEGIGNALSHAHKSNVVHRDIKPGNIMLTDDGQVKVLDFGIASKINENENDATKFNADTLESYTLWYASPEMLRGFETHPKDDIYAFACVIYEMLTGERFFDQKISKAESIFGLSKKQMEALNKALSPERDNRTATVNDLLLGLQPNKPPLLKYTGICVGLVSLLGLSYWRMAFFSEANKTPVVEPLVVESTFSRPVEPESAPPAIESPLVKTDELKVIKPDNIATSPDGIIKLNATQENYSVNDFFTLNFTLAETRYAVLIIQDAQGEAQIIRPSPNQDNTSFLANKSYSFPPENTPNVSKYFIGKNTVTVIASVNPLVRNVNKRKAYNKDDLKDLLNDDGTVTERVKNSSYSWVQIHFTINE
jgi:serine/threonine protein kinase